MDTSRNPFYLLKAVLEDGDLDFSLVGFSGEAAVLLPSSLRISRGK